MAALQIEVSPLAEGITVVQLVGPADIPGAGFLEQKLTFLAAKHPKHVIFDLSGLTFISSLAMGTIMTFRRGCLTWGGRITLAAASEGIASALKHARLDALLPMTNTVEAAVAAQA